MEAVRSARWPDLRPSRGPDQPSPTLSGGEAERIERVTGFATVRDCGADAPARGACVLDARTAGPHEFAVDPQVEADRIPVLGPEDCDGDGDGDGDGTVVDAVPPVELARRDIEHTGRVPRVSCASRRARRSARADGAASAVSRRASSRPGARAPRPSGRP